MFRARAVVVMLLFPAAVGAQDVDPRLLAYINAIQAIDNHAHVVAPDAEHDQDFDALPCDILPSTSPSLPANMRFGSDVQAAWKALFNVTADSASPDSLARWQAAKKAAQQQRGAAYFDWIAQQAGMDVILANRVTMARELGSTHYRWVPYDDALLFPLNDDAEKAESPDKNALFQREEQHLENYLHAVGLDAPPTAFDDYLRNVVTATLESQKSAGAVAIKFEVAYLRPLDFASAMAAEAGDVYARYIAGGTPAKADYRRLQDYLFRFVAGEAGRLGLAVHIHTGTGCGEYFDDRGSDPMLLDSVLNDPALRATKFVLLHGGAPFDRHNLALIVKPNVWVDTSSLSFWYSPDEVARIIRPWLDTLPEHVIFGTDAGPIGPGFEWEEATWIASRKGRRALAIALTQLIHDGAITSARANAIADGVLRQNAAALYGIER